MTKVQKVKPEELEIQYDYHKALALSKNRSGVFPGNKDVQKMLKMILDINDNKHIFLSVSNGTEAEEFLVEVLRYHLKDNLDKHKIYDWCYIYNFKETNRPILIRLELGSGNSFKQMIEESVKKSFDEIKNCFKSKTVKEYEKIINDNMIKKGEKELEELKVKAKEMGFSTHVSEKGIFFIPIINGKKISEEQYDNLTALEQEKIVQELDRIDKSSKAVLEKVKTIKTQLKNKISTVRKRIINEIIEENFNEVLNEYINNEKIYEYIENIKTELGKDLANNIMDMDIEDIDVLNEVINIEEANRELDDKYKVNFLQKETDDYPIIYAKKFSYYELFGKIEYKNEVSAYTTDFTLIKPGIIHHANGGYLIMDVNDLLNNKLIWDKFKKILYDRKISFESIREKQGGLAIKTLQPESMPLDFKIILIGRESVYNLLYEFESDFREIFAYHLDISKEVELNDDNIADYIAYFKGKGLTSDGIKALIEYGIKRTGNKEKITSELSALKKLLIISNQFAKEDGVEFIDKIHIKKGEMVLHQLNNHYQKKVNDLILKNQLLINVNGSKVGQINGLSVFDCIDCLIAKPIRITATTHTGEGGIISIEKENKLNGKIFGKGIGIVEGYLSSQLSNGVMSGINCYLCFEQVYGQIEGDSALCAETYAILSSLARVPINQNIAITGSMDQFGNVQPIGSVSRKIEGFYFTCLIKGLTGDQGVLVPIQNKSEIVLEDSVYESVEKGEFHIYTFEHIEEGIPLLMNTTFDELKSMIVKSKKLDNA